MYISECCTEHTREPTARSSKNCIEASIILVPEWCICQNCVEMPTAAERKCCKKAPSKCLALDHHWYFLLNPFNIALHNGFRSDILAEQEEANKNKSLRHGLYRMFIMWVHKKLSGDRRVIPSCCVWKIRNEFPDEFRQYTGFKPSKFG